VHKICVLPSIIPVDCYTLVGLIHILNVRVTTDVYHGTEQKVKINRVLNRNSLN
jgi:hypothetical protein